MLGYSYPNTDGAVAIRDWTCESGNPGGYCNPHIHTLFSKGLAMEVTNPEGARELWTKLDRALVQDAAIVPMWTDNAYALVSTRVGNWSTTNAGASVLLDQLWVK